MITLCDFKIVFFHPKFQVIQPLVQCNNFQLFPTLFDMKITACHPSIVLDEVCVMKTLIINGDRVNVENK